MTRPDANDKRTALGSLALDGLHGQVAISSFGATVGRSVERWVCAVCDRRCIVKAEHLKREGKLFLESGSPKINSIKLLA